MQTIIVFFHSKSNFISHATYNRVASCSRFAKPLVPRAHYHFINTRSTNPSFFCRNWNAFFRSLPQCFHFCLQFYDAPSRRFFFRPNTSSSWFNLFCIFILANSIDVTNIDFVYMYKANISYTELLTQLATE